MEYGERNYNVDKRTWINIGLLALIVLLSALLLIPGNQTKPGLPRLSTIDRNEVVKIKVLRKGLDSFIFNKQGDTWYMNSPLHFRANSSRINAMLHILKTESYGQLNPADVELSRLDLDDPVVVMKLNNHEFRFGNTDAIDQRRYVLFDNTIYMTNDFLYQQLMANAAFFADTRLFPEEPEINSIEFPEAQIDLVDGKWQTLPLMDTVPGKIKRLVHDWQTATAISMSKYEAPETESLITISTSSDEQIKFVIVATEPHLILGRKDLGIQYHMGSDEAEKLLLNQNSGTDDLPESIDDK